MIFCGIPAFEKFPSKLRKFGSIVRVRARKNKQAKSTGLFHTKWMFSTNSTSKDKWNLPFLSKRFIYLALSINGFINSSFILHNPSKHISLVFYCFSSLLRPFSITLVWLIDGQSSISIKDGYWLMQYAMLPISNG